MGRSCPCLMCVRKWCELMFVLRPMPAAFLPKAPCAGHRTPVLIALLIRVVASVCWCPADFTSAWKSKMCGSTRQALTIALV